MNILVDENMPVAVVAAFAERGHDVLDVRGTMDEGARDEDLWAIACREQRLLVTTDKDFRVFRSTPRHYGILIVCLRRPSTAAITRRTLEIFDRLDPRGWAGTTVLARDVAAVVWTTPHPYSNGARCDTL